MNKYHWIHYVFLHEIVFDNGTDIDVNKKKCQVCDVVSRAKG